ncbi:MAG: sensor histidine kinase, partial [Actinomycetes bacterium]
GRTPGATLVDDVVDQQLAEWSPSYAADGRTIDVQGERGAVVQGAPGAVSLVLATLLENSLVHGGGRTKVAVRRAESAVVVQVSDEGPGVPAGLAQHVFERSVSGGGGHGVGLALARSTAESAGGRLELTTASSATFALFLHEAR